MAGTGGWYGRWVAAARPSATRHGLVAVGSSLGLLAFVEVIARSAASQLDPERALVLTLLALGTTLPVAAFGAPAAALVVGAVSVLSLAGFGSLTVAGCCAVLVTLFRLGLDLRAGRPLLAAVPALVVPYVVLAFVGRSPTASEAAGLTTALAVLAPAALFGGWAVRAGQEADEHRAARQVIAETLSEHTARGERARIARELHDVVAHHISMIALQAESTRLAVPGLPAAGAQRLSAIGDTARAALAEMRGLLGVLREDAALDVPDRHPQPGLGQVTDLIDEARAASGCGTRLILRGHPIPLDPNVELVAYRIVQEALTNSRRHAPGAAVDVELAYDHHALCLRVRDNGPGPLDGTPPGGHGVVGMQERASAVGGTVRTGPAPGGGYLVEALLPAKIERPG